MADSERYIGDREWVTAYDSGIAESIEPGQLQPTDEQERIRICHSHWVGSVAIQNPYPGAQVLDSSLGPAVRELAGRNCIADISTRTSNMHLTFGLLDGTKASHYIVELAGHMAGRTLKLPEHSLLRLRVDKVDISEYNVQRVLAQAGVRPFPRPPLRIV